VCVSSGVSATGAASGTASDVTTQISATAVVSALPPTCSGSGTTAAATGAVVGGKDVVSKLVTAMSTSDRVQTAATNIITCLTNLQTLVDSVTGVMIAAQCDFSLVGVATPKTTNSGVTYEVDVYTAFVAKAGTTAITADHRRVYCPCVKGYIGDLTGVTANSDCTEASWTVTGKKRAISQSSSASTYRGTVPGSGVQSQYGSSSPSTTVIAHVGLFLVMVLFTVFM